jgi:hypothetical protein
MATTLSELLYQFSLRDVQLSGTSSNAVVDRFSPAIAWTIHGSDCLKEAPAGGMDRRARGMPARGFAGIMLTKRALRSVRDRTGRNAVGDQQTNRPFSIYRLRVQQSCQRMVTVSLRK